jgi:hypothetical protein
VSSLKHFQQIVGVPVLVSVCSRVDLEFFAGCIFMKAFQDFNSRMSKTHKFTVITFDAEVEFRTLTFLRVVS